MAGKFVSMRNLKFLLYEIFDAPSLTKAPHYGKHNQKSFDLALEAAMQLSQKLLYPVFEEMDRKTPYLENGEVKVHPSVRKMMKEYGRSGWIGFTFPEKINGKQLPNIIYRACQLIISAANYSASVYPELTSGAAGILHTFGSKKLQETFIPKLLAGEWQGTMALTEPTAGSSLSDIVTTAVPTEQGHYLLKGQKAFLTAGDHNGVDNVVHLVVARIKGAENGIKGLSLFVVPKKRLNENDELVPNDVIVNRVVNKMGYRGVPITELSFGNNNDCHGYLVGESNQNLMYLFKVMNEPRIGVGTGAAALASAAYYTALEYCKTRSQGRKVTSKDSSAPQIPIIEHADVRRMLLFQRAIVEGSEALLLQCAKYEDNVKILPEEKTEHYRLLLDLLIPIAKSYPSEMGLLSISQSIQCLGGYGYCEDFPVEQYFRDARIHSIHQGTTGIQGKDLLGRKILMQEGKAFNLFLEETQKAIDAAAMLEKIKPLAYTFEDALNWLSQVTASLAKVMAKKGIDIYLADATLYLEAFSIITIAWQWLQQATAAQTALDDKNKSNDTNFYQGKLTTAKYFFAYELPKISGLIQRLTDGNPLTVNMKNCYFDD